MPASDVLCIMLIVTILGGYYIEHRLPLASPGNWILNERQRNSKTIDLYGVARSESSHLVVKIVDVFSGARYSQVDKTCFVGN